MRRRFLHEGCLEPGKPSGLSRRMPKPSSEHADGKIVLLYPKPCQCPFLVQLGGLIRGRDTRARNQIPPGPCFVSGWSSSPSIQKSTGNEFSRSHGTATFQLTMPRSRYPQPEVRQFAAAQQCLRRSHLWSGGCFVSGIAPTLTTCAGPRSRPPLPGENQGT